jgi:hypothetical protein
MAARAGSIEAKEQLVRMHVMKQRPMESNETMRKLMEELIDLGSADATNLKAKSECAFESFSLFL